MVLVRWLPVPALARGGALQLRLLKARESSTFGSRCCNLIEIPTLEHVGRSLLRRASRNQLNLTGSRRSGRQNKTCTHRFITNYKLRGNS